VVAPAVAPSPDPLEEALELIRGAASVGVPLKLVGGLAVRVLCPDFPPRRREGQDLDLASSSSARATLTAFLVERAYEPDKRFNALYGHKQLYFASPAGRSVDVLIDRLEMCHVVEFAGRIDRMPLTLDVTDLLLSKLQIVDLTEKDAQDAIYLLARFPVEEGDEPGAIGLQPIRALVADDWGWWRTLTMNLERIATFATADGSHLVPSNAAQDVLHALERLSESVTSVPKTVRWRIRAKVGEHKRWYRVPELDAHD
jgi:hypothetical protein